MVSTLLRTSLCLALLAQPILGTAASTDSLTPQPPLLKGEGVAPPRQDSPPALGEGSGGEAVRTSPTAGTLSATAAVLAPLPGRPGPIVRTPNNPVEDFFAVTLISMPFTAFWSLLGALAVGGVAQHRFPPDFDTPMLAGAAAVAAGASLTTGLVSIQWGGSRLSPTPAPTPSPSPAP